MKKYVVIAPINVSTSAGITGLHQLNEHLNTAGQSSRVLVFPGIGDTLPKGVIMPSDDEIAIIPDCFAGNLFKAKNVVRYLMMFAGYFGLHTDSDFPESEYMYYYSADFILNGRNADNILTIPMLDENKFAYNTQGRSGSCYLAIKYHDYFGFQPTNLPEDCVRIDKAMDLGELFRTKKKLITFDNSAMNIEAALAGMEVEYRFNEKFEKHCNYGDFFDYSDVPASYSKQKKVYFEKQLPDFIVRTQERFK